MGSGAKWEKGIKWEAVRVKWLSGTALYETALSGRTKRELAKWDKAYDGDSPEKAPERTPVPGRCAAALLETVKAVWTPSLPVRHHPRISYRTLHVQQPTCAVGAIAAARRRSHREYSTRTRAQPSEPAASSNECFSSGLKRSKWGREYSQYSEWRRRRSAR